MTTDTTVQKCQTSTCSPEHVRAGRTYSPCVDIVERPEELLLVADLPGVKSQDLSINYERGLLTVHGGVSPRRDEKAGGCLLCEYGVGDFVRSFQVGEGIDAGRIEAELSGGVLTLHLPKRQEVMPRKIAVESA